ncbi:MAG: hypothetical protein CME31_21710 [Gimesia sp.]|uniref:Uncharacterized protein n=1 Tax=Gimesia maris TaxID=122 RepID=A0A3D3R9A5_9PLAN|nr:hypothetical protein [Gimesia sp.]HCO24668.1 hypothetical protein [Gimesia maris]|tara:strand:+ start:98565 stop:98927 length:363 start_codon:yes stop_codon:yes gene_type:complete
MFEAQHQVNLLEAGAAARLIISGGLKTLLQTEDSKAMEAANPVQADGSVVFDKSADEAREDTIVRNLLKVDGVVVIILVGGHDLADNIKREGAAVIMSWWVYRSIRVWWSDRRSGLHIFT